MKLRSYEWFDRLLAGCLTASVGILLVGLFSWQVPFGSQVQLSEGQVAPYDVVAPRQISYESQVLTERARERAAQGVPDQFDTPDGRVRRQQMERAQDVLEYISIVRADEYASDSLRTDYLLSIPDVALTPELAEQILALSPQEWQRSVDEVPATLDRLMREEIRESNLAAYQRRVPAQLASDLSEPTAQVVTELVRALIRPNSLFNQTRTDEMRERARNDIPVQRVDLERNEIIVRAGDIATVEHVEALTQIGLLRDQWNWWTTARGFALVLALFGVMGGTLYRLRPRTLTNMQEYSMLVILVVVWLLAAKFMVVPHDWLPYLYPLAALGMLVAVMIDLRVAVITVIGFSLIAHFLAPNNTMLVVYLCLGSLAGAVVLGRAERLTAFLWAGLAVAVVNWLTLAAFRLPFDEFTPSRLIQLHVVVFLNGGLSASVAMIGYLVLGNLFGITTSLQLTELSRPTHPLLRQLLLKASGTYHHTIIVSNLAERAAAAIGADAFLTRVGAYYHDIGKTVRPYFFAENIVDSASPHDKLDALTSAQIIISHVSDGLDLAHKYHLPARIQDFIREHHGRTMVKFFYVQAEREAGENEVVDPADYSYPGPSPRSKETAILFLADMCEAAVRAIRPATREELETLVNRLIDERVGEGELNESNLTFRELQVIKEVFLQVLQGVHHPRIQYPEPVRKPKGKTEAEAGAEGIQDGQARGANGAGATVPLPGGMEEPAGV
ncbi:MAG: HDIG domain-containing protein [Caldilineaceae bacterium]|nr:HDIG domain-containing protein [Caldilineaceae bacterium]